jgi:1-acyl-sn-glycerol-3-phosphate acyltransferase
MDDWDLQPARDHGLPLGERLRSTERETGLIGTGLHLGWWAAVRVYLSLWHRLTFRGRQHLPVKPPFVVVANHTSHLDAFVLACPLPWRVRDRIFPIAAGDVFFETPAMTAFASSMLNALPMWRKKCGSHAMQQLRRRLVEEPCAYILFPEGTRSRDGTMGNFKPGLGMLVAETKVPVIPCYLDGCFEALRPEQKWPRCRRISLHVGAPLVFGDVANDRPGWMQIAERTHAEVKRLSGPV